jgi:alpha-L-fucosidase 2
MLKQWIFIVSFFNLFTFANGQDRSLKLWYDKPASRWEETLPLGNGRLGMMPDGGIADEKIVLNEISLWSGASQDANNYEAYKSLPQIRKLLAEGKNDEAQELINKNFVCKGIGSAGVPFGCYQLLGNLAIHFNYKHPADTNSYTNYNRELDLGNAVARCTYKMDGVTYRREYFTSFDDDVNVIKLSANRPGNINFTLLLDRPERSVTATTGAALFMYGQLAGNAAKGGMKYVIKAALKLDGGRLIIHGNTLVVKNATSVIIYISAATNFRSAGYRRQANSRLNAALQEGYIAERRRHMAAFHKLFNRVNLMIGNKPAFIEATSQRLRNFQNNPDADTGLPILFYQFGRYLSICSTRVGLLPPNLQGLWANQVQTPWNGDYHLDVNVEMNHWPVEVSNLSELDLPLAALVKGMMKHGERTAKAYYNARGRVAHVITNIWGFTEPGESASWGVTKVGSGWLCNNLWQHYTFTEDKRYLKSIYPVLKGSARFYSDMLILDPKTGWLLTSPSSSPENTFYLPNGNTASICEGPTIDNQIVRELFDNVISASRSLGVDKAFRDSLAEQIKHLPPVGRIGTDGRLMEWLENYKETDVHHRHVSHLYGLYPASLITPEATPDLAEACRKTLNARGDDGPSWSIAYKMLFWARLHDGNRAYKLFKAMMRPALNTGMNYGAGGGVYANLLSAGPPFQIDGNLGAAAGIAEMLLQSHAGFIELLPAVPDAWKTSGEVNGLKARGNITVSFKWRNGKITRWHLTSPVTRKVKLKMNGEMREVSVTNS